MAIFIPEYDYIKTSMSAQLTDNERNALDSLFGLSDDYHVFYKPYFDGFSSHIIILNKDIGINIINIFDHCDASTIKSQLNSLIRLKKYLYNFNLKLLSRTRLKDNQTYGLVKLILCVPSLSYRDLNELKVNVMEDIDENDINDFKYTALWGGNKSPKERIEGFKTNNSFTDDIISEALEFFNPILPGKLDINSFKLDSQQEKLSKSKPGATKIRGVAGSGKTVVLANRAINAYERTKKTVLILTFNKSLHNYIYHNIARFTPIDSVVNKTSFFINNFHRFLIDFFENSDWYKNLVKDIAYSKVDKVEEVEEVDDGSEYFLDDCYDEKDENTLDERFNTIIDNLIDNVHLIPEDCRFDTIFVDEVQDFKPKWLELLRKALLNEGGEYVLFGDEKQNIYKRDLELEDRRAKTNIAGAWNTLKTNHRCIDTLSILANNFQSKFMHDKYNIEVAYQEGLFINGTILNYYNIPNLNNDILYDIICQTAGESDCRESYLKNSILLSKLDHLLDFEKYLSSKSMETITTFTTNFEINEIEDSKGSISENVDNPSGIIKSAVWKLEDKHKRAFDMNVEKFKLSTIHSFKGLESENIFFIIDPKSDDSIEIIYTALTRCRKNLVIIDLNSADDSNPYYNFFSEFLVDYASK